MHQTNVLAIGLDPHCADFRAMPHLTADLVGRYIDAEIARLRQLGFEVDACLIAPDGTAEAEIEAILGPRGSAAS